MKKVYLLTIISILTLISSMFVFAQIAQNLNKNGGSIQLEEITIIDEGTTYESTPKRFPFYLNEKYYALQIRKIKDNFAIFYFLKLGKNHKIDISDFTLEKAVVSRVEQAGAGSHPGRCTERGSRFVYERAVDVEARHAAVPRPGGVRPSADGGVWTCRARATATRARVDEVANPPVAGRVDCHPTTAKANGRSVDVTNHEAGAAHLGLDPRFDGV